MSYLNSEHALQEFLYNLQQKDLIKARLVLEHIEEIDPKAQKRILFELSRCEDDFALPLLVLLKANKSQVFELYPTLQEIFFSKALENEEVILRGLEQGGPEQDVYIELATEMKLERAVPLLIEQLQKTVQEERIVSIIQAIGLLGDASATNAITEFLNVHQKDIAQASVQALGQIASPTALQRLFESLGRNQEIDLMILDILANLQNETSLEKLNQCLQSADAFVRNQARHRLVKVGSKAVPMLSRNLLYKDPDLQIISLNVLGEIKDSSAVQPIRKLLNDHPKDPNLRFAAYEALGLLPLHKGAYTLAQGLTDPVENVRIAAAKAIDHNFNQLLLAGVKNMLKAQDSESKDVVRAILDSRSGRIFLGLLEDEDFQESALNYLRQKAHPEVKSFFLKLLQENDFHGLSEKIEISQAQEKPKQKICAVDDSQMVLRIYQSTLFELGFEAEVFSNPKEAQEWVIKNKPKLLFTDLNMPEIDGINLTKSLRKSFSPQELPIVMVTTQNDLQDRQNAMQAGVNEIIFKPFTSEDLEKILSKLISS